MSPSDFVYVGHMLDIAKKAVSKTQGPSREIVWQVATQDLPTLVAALEPIVPPEPPVTNGL